MQYVWLNINDGQFSNSWSENEHRNLTEADLEKAKKDGWKLLKYECVNDTAFKLSHLMRLK
jgi:hypothetical protein